MSIWDCCERLNEVVDESDPDLDKPQIQHLLQSAEAIRKGDKDWLRLTALIHVRAKCTSMARIFGLDQTEENTSRIVGTIVKGLHTMIPFTMMAKTMNKMMQGSSYHPLWVENLSNLLKTDLKKGIDGSADDILQRKQEFGANTYPAKKGKGFWSSIWTASLSPPFLVIVLAAVIKSLLRIKRKDIHDGWYEEPCIILFIVFAIIVKGLVCFWSQVS